MPLRTAHRAFAAGSTTATAGPSGVGPGPHRGRAGPGITWVLQAIRINAAAAGPGLPAQYNNFTLIITATGSGSQAGLRVRRRQVSVHSICLFRAGSALFRPLNTGSAHYFAPLRLSIAAPHSTPGARMAGGRAGSVNSASPLHRFPAATAAISFQHHHRLASGLPPGPGRASGSRPGRPATTTPPAIISRFPPPIQHQPLLLPGYSRPLPAIHRSAISRRLCSLPAAAIKYYNSGHFQFFPALLSFHFFRSTTLQPAIQSRIRHFRRRLPAPFSPPPNRQIHRFRFRRIAPPFSPRAHFRLSHRQRFNFHRHSAARSPTAIQLRCRHAENAPLHYASPPLFHAHQSRMRRVSLPDAPSGPDRAARQRTPGTLPSTLRFQACHTLQAPPLSPPPPLFPDPGIAIAHYRRSPPLHSPFAASPATIGSAPRYSVQYSCARARIFCHYAVGVNNASNYPPHSRLHLPGLYRQRRRDRRNGGRPRRQPPRQVRHSIAAVSPAAGVSPIRRLKAYLITQYSPAAAHRIRHYYCWILQIPDRWQFAGHRIDIRQVILLAFATPPHQLQQVLSICHSGFAASVAAIMLR